MEYSPSSGRPSWWSGSTEIEVFVVTSETEALLLEQNLIKRHRPMFNIRLRDDKSYPYIAVTVGDEYPRVMFTRERHRKGVQYFGPYSSARKVRETLDVLNRVFPYRPCEGPTPGRRSGVPCLDYHIGRCGAPCVGYVSKQEYGTVIDSVIEFLSGRVRPLERDLEKADAGGRRVAPEYEEAARYRNRLTAVRHLSETQVADKRSLGSADVLAVAVAGDNANVQLFHLRDGAAGRSPELLPREHRGRGRVRGAVGICARVLRRPCRDPGPGGRCHGRSPTPSCWKRSWGSGAARLVEVRAAQRGEKRRIAELAAQNATLALEHDALLAQRSRARRVEALEELRERLNLEKLPVRIECFDVSNLGDTNHRCLDGGVRGRGREALPTIGRSRSGTARDRTTSRACGKPFPAGSRGCGRSRPIAYDESFAATPSLVVIDGGKGQLNAALDAMAEFDLPRVAVISLAKRIEEVFVPGRPDPIMLDPASNGLQLLQRVRDEAHRFALGRHRKRRARSSVESIFDSLPGVGPARKRLLIEHFGTPERFVSATRDELESVPGLPAKVARQIHQSLHKAGR